VVAAAFRGILAAVASAITVMTGPAGGQPTVLPSTTPAARPALEANLNAAQQAIDAPASSPATIQSAAQFEQLATQDLARRPRADQRAIVSGLSAAAASTINTNLDAAASLSQLSTPRRSLPAWRIEQPPAPATLLGYFRAAQARTGVPWEYLAAIEFVETSFGRVHGLSTAGAEGPMQFLPATWARYGTGNVQDPTDAILGAARLLTANGAPRDMDGALYHYNPSPDYVRAVTDYALRMRADPHAYYAYYWWQVLYVRRGRLLLLPVGYPEAKPVAVTSPATPPSG
jgi:membrane-bound lytic murein transglycosylase B